MKSLRNLLFWLLVLSIGIVILGREAEAKKLTVVATTEQTAAIAQIVGGNKVDVRYVMKGYRNPYGQEPNPDMTKILDKADVFVVNGQALEVGWLTESASRSRNPIVLAGSQGYVDASEGIDIIPYAAEEIQQGPYFFINIIVGGVHKMGNHHYFLEPDSGGIIAKNIADKLSEVDKGNAGYYQANREAFQKKLDEKLKEWDGMMAPYKGTPIVMYHRSWNYLARRHDFPILGFLEPRETLQLDPDHTASIVRQMKSKGVKVIIEETYYHTDETEKIAKEAGAVLITLPASVSKDRGINDYFQLFDEIYGKLSAGFKQAKGAS